MIYCFYCYHIVITNHKGDFVTIIFQDLSMHDNHRLWENILQGISNVNYKNIKYLIL